MPAVDVTGAAGSLDDGSPCPAREVQYGHARNTALHNASRGLMGPMPGTVVLVFIFLAAFIVYFFVNWKILSFLWRIG